PNQSNINYSLYLRNQLATSSHLGVLVQKLTCLDFSRRFDPPEMFCLGLKKLTYPVLVIWRSLIALFLRKSAYLQKS
ncbi:MAG: hypothetical protein VW233_08400, partial [Paracoccaceae bacterium]